MKTSKVECFCNTCSSENNYYKCAGCERIVPYCFGCADAWYYYCDDCAYELSQNLTTVVILKA